MKELPHRPVARSPRQPTLTLVIDDALRRRLDKHRDVNWSEVIRQHLDAALQRLEKRK